MSPTSHQNTTMQRPPQNRPFSALRVSVMSPYAMKATPANRIARSIHCFIAPRNLFLAGRHDKRNEGET